MPSEVAERSRPGHRPTTVVQPDASAEEWQLVRSAKADPLAFAPLYQRYVEIVYRYCYRRLGTADQAADATSQVFVKAIASLASCREESFRSWLFAIAHNVMIDSYRGRRPEVTLDDDLSLSSQEASPEEIAIANDERREIVKLLDLLTPDQRQVVELRLAGLNGNEIAATLGRSRASVDTAQSRAVSRLRIALNVLASEGEEGEAHNAIA